VIGQCTPSVPGPRVSLGRLTSEHWSSFPSDTLALLFAIAAGFWLGSRWLGLVFGVFALSTSLARVYLGIHYPSDILVGAMLGIATSIALDRDFVRRKIAAPILAIETFYPPYFYGVFFVNFPSSRMDSRSRDVLRSQSYIYSGDTADSKVARMSEAISGEGHC
jgi:hypothetical protein